MIAALSILLGACVATVVYVVAVELSDRRHRRIVREHGILWWFTK